MYIFTEHGVVYYNFAHWLNAWETRINGFKNYRVENVIKQLIHASAVHSSRYEALGKFAEHPHLSCSPNFPRASYLDEAC